MFSIRYSSRLKICIDSDFDSDLDVGTEDRIFDSMIDMSPMKFSRSVFDMRSLWPQESSN